MASNNKKWRHDHPKKWSEQKARQRAMNRTSIGATTKTWRPWTIEEACLIIAENRSTDRELSAQLGKTMVAIQMMRHRINSGEIEFKNGKLCRVTTQQVK